MTTSAPLPHAGVNFPPPFVYVAGILVGWLLNRRWRLPITGGGSSAREALAVVLMVAWLAISVGAFAAFRRHKTTIVPNRPASAVVTDGPYRYTRNPMYVSLVSLYLGLALLMNTWWAIILLPVVILVVDRKVIAREERYLSSAFPDAYGPYSARVRRWV
jgi:protein-S-isoprenylcysteine O-methyltransferase Ste14